MNSTDHNALNSALDVAGSNKTYEFRLTRWLDRLILYNFKIMHIPGELWVS